MLFRFLTAVALLCTLAACQPDALPQKDGAFHSLNITGVRYAQGFELPDSQGQRRTLADFKGQVVVVFFGYTHCPDVCPITLAELKEAKRQMGELGDRVQGIFITLDPERDTPALLSQYVPAFDPSFIALRGSPEATRKLAAHYRVYSKVVGDEQDPDYSIDHTAASFIYDTQGRIRLYNRFNQGPERLAADLSALLQEASPTAARPPPSPAPALTP